MYAGRPSPLDRPKRGAAYVVALVGGEHATRRYVVEATPGVRRLSTWLDWFPGESVRLVEGTAWADPSTETTPIGETTTTPPSAVVLRDEDGALYGLRSSGDVRHGYAVYTASEAVWRSLRGEDEPVRLRAVGE
jgi:hypothetical protein